MSLTFKLLSLAIRTAAKPIGNRIKKQAQDHPGFRKFAIAQAQKVHRIDMRMRLGILHDPEAQQRMHERELRAAEEKRKKEEAPTVRTAEEQKKHDERKAKEAQEDGKKQEKSTKVKIRPLSDARAIELGANFFSEAFIFMVAVSLILLENWRSSRKSSQRGDEIAERLEALEAQVERLQSEHHLPELEALNEKIKRARAERKKSQWSWYNPVSWVRKPDDESEDDGEDYRGVPGEVEGQEVERKDSTLSRDGSGKSVQTREPVEKPLSKAAIPPRLDSVKAESKQR